MTQRIGTGANAEITVYAVTLSTTQRQLETSVPVGGAIGALTSQSPSPTASRALNTNRLDGIYLFSTAGTPIVKVIGV